MTANKVLQNSRHSESGLTFWRHTHACIYSQISLIREIEDETNADKLTRICIQCPSYSVEQIDISLRKCKLTLAFKDTAY